jgi:Ca2+-binding RTX toxin-like protein
VDGVDQLKGPGASVGWDGGAAGNVINGGRLADELAGNGGNDTMDGHWGNDTMDGGTGDDNITGGWGKDLFVFGLDSGNDTIEDFMNHKDLIDVSAYAAIQDINDFAGLSESAGDVIIDIDGVNTITLVDTSLAEINNSDFLFA